MCFTQNFWNYAVQGLSIGFVYALIALGYTLVYGVLQLINFAHSEVFMLGGFAGYFSVRPILEHMTGSAAPSGMASVLIVVLGVVGGGVGGAIVAFLLERVAYRPLRKRGAPKLAFLISAIGASLFLVNLAGKEFGRDNVRINRPPIYDNGPVFHIFGAPVTNTQLIIAGAAITILVALDRIIARTRLGQGIRAVAQDVEAAKLMGVDIDKVIVRTFVIGGVLGGVAGFLYTLQYGVQYTMGFLPGVKAFTAAVLGGIGNVRGAVLGGLLLGLVEKYGVACIDTKWSDVIAFLVLVVVLLFRPTGILGERLGRSA